jgi:hypothetical protein
MFSFIYLLFIIYHLFFQVFIIFIKILHCKKCKLKTYFLILHSSVFYKAIYTRQ